MIGSPEILHRNKKPRKASQSEWSIRIVENKKLGGWIYARGVKNNIVMSAVFNSREEAQQAGMNAITWGTK